MDGGIRWGGMASASSSTINIGTLVLDMYDPSTKQLVWAGNANHLDSRARSRHWEKC